MADRKNGGLLEPNPRNETSGGSGPEDYDESGAGLYGDLKEVMAVHLSQDSASLLESPNVKEGSGIMGGPAPGEPNPYGFSGTAEGNGKSSK
jgi:hypothetical protein